MSRIDDDFEVLQELAHRIETDYQNAGWYMHRAYMLGQGRNVADVLAKPLENKMPLRLIIGGKND